MNDLAGKRVMVIGGETGLGRAIVIGLAEAGADVAIASLTPDTQAEFAINSALNELWALDRKGVALAVDASDAEMLRRATEQAESEVGPLDLVAVCHAGTVKQLIRSALAKNRLPASLTEERLLDFHEGHDPADALMAISERLGS